MTAFDDPSRPKRAWAGPRPHPGRAGLPRAARPALRSRRARSSSPGGARCSAAFARASCRTSCRTTACGPRGRAGRWRPAPPTSTDRRVEITGPVERKMMINALNSGARVFMADFEDALSPPWTNVDRRAAQLHGRGAAHARVREPRGQALPASASRSPRWWSGPGGGISRRSTSCVDGRPVPASLFDFGLYFFHNARELLARGSGPYFYLPKLESHLEARLWNEVFDAAQDALGMPRGTIRATVLIETILAAFEMDEILYELRDARGRAQRRPLGLPLQHHQELPGPPGVHPARPGPAHDDGAVHAGVHRAAGADLPPAATPTPSAGWRRSFPAGATRR